MKEQRTRRQYKYQIGAVVKFQPSYIYDWYNRYSTDKIVDTDYGIVREVNQYFVAVEIYSKDGKRKPPTKYTKSFRKSRDVYLTTYEQKMLEML